MAQPWCLMSSQAMARSDSDTIVACSTAPGVGAIAIVRLSGPRAVALAGACFEPVKPGRALDAVPSHLLSAGRIVDPRTGEVIDKVLVAVMRAPHSYTGEDVVEIHCHGSPVVVREVIEALIGLGARLARPGEFTRRAYENGRIDLAQAEAVCDLITAETTRARRIALHQLEGRLSEQIRDLRSRLLDTLAEAEAYIDFPEEDLPPVRVEHWLEELARVVEKIEVLISQGERGRLAREGIRVVITGRPNVGKSSLFNQIVGHERAIVSPHPGTTRDTIEARVEIAGMPVTFVDTAGLRAQAEQIEHLGIARAQKEIASASVVMLCVDASQPWSREDDEAWEIVKGSSPVIVLTKIDLVPYGQWQEGLTIPLRVDQIIETSALTGKGVDDLIGLLRSRLVEAVDGSEEILISNLRHLTALRAAREALGRAREALGKGLSPEFASADMHEALAELGQIAGPGLLQDEAPMPVSEELLDLIFSRFCIGK